MRSELENFVKMADKKLEPSIGKYIRLSPTGNDIFADLRKCTGFTDGELVEIMAAQMSIRLRRDVARAQRFLYLLLVRNIETITVDELRKMIPAYKRPRGRRPANPT